MSLKASATLIFVFSLCVVSAKPQDSIPSEPYNVAEAYKIYSLLLQHEPSYPFGKDTVMIRQEALVASTPCLTTPAEKKFADAVVALNRLQRKRWLLQPRFQIDRPYKLIGPEVIKTLPSRPESVTASYVEMSTVGFNRDKTRALVFMGKSCGGLCGHWTYHLLEKVQGKWKEVPGVNCSIAS
ncbi:MAG TPA: hypothetical protein VNW47_04215 [Terriglobales bacterium]|jgi:hypothetical protein|nr:hypothetical protein [Terriglobales bacterium]